MRRKVLTAACLLIALLFSGCMSYSPENNNFDTREFYANIKADADADSGKKAACFGGRVWYLSAESGTQGVHSMAADGTDVRLEFATEDIRALTVREDGLWYAGYAGQNENYCGEYRDFRLYARRAGRDAPEDILGLLTPAQLTQLEFGSNVWDFYPASDGSIVVLCVYPRLPVGSMALDPAVLLPDEGFLVPRLALRGALRCDYEISNDEIQETNCGYDTLLLQRGTLLLLGGADGWTDLSVYDNANEHIAFSNDLLLNSEYQTAYSPRYLFRVEGDWLYFASNEEVLAFRPEPLAARQITTFTEPERIFGCYDAGSELYVLTERVNWWPLRNVLGRANREALYRVDMETGEKARLLQLGPGAAIVYLDGATAVTASRQTLTVYDLSGELPAVSRTVALAHKVVDKANKADTAGGWWFLYRFNEETGRDELIEKVRLDG